MIPASIPRKVTLGRRFFSILTALAVPLLLLNTSCRSLLTQTPPEITLPDGDVPGMQSIDGDVEGSKGVEFVALNFTGRHHSMISIDGHGSSSVDKEWGSWRRDASISIPREFQTPFYVRVSWTDSTYPTSQPRSQEWGGGIDYFDEDIYKSKLVKVEGPIPPDANTFLVIFYPKDRIVCEILGEHLGVEDRIEALRNKKGNL